jgi:hypothetical protein
MEFRDELKDEYQKARAEWDGIDRDLVKWGGASVAGAVATGGFSLTLPALGFSIAAVTQLILAHLKRREFRMKVPMSVFVDLATHKKKQ